MLVAVAGCSRSPWSPPPGAAAAAKPPQRQVILLGLAQPGNPPSSWQRSRIPPRRAIGSSSNPASSASARAAEERSHAVRRYLASQSACARSRRARIAPCSSPWSRPGRKAAFCARASARPPAALHAAAPARDVRQLSAGEVYQLGSSSPDPAGTRAPAAAVAHGCADASHRHVHPGRALDRIRSRRPARARPDRRGIRVATLSAQEVEAAGFRTWARCFGLRRPRSAVRDAERDPPRARRPTRRCSTSRRSPRWRRARPDHADLRPARPELRQLVRLFMLGALDRPRLGRQAAALLSISDAVCESRFTGAS